VQVFESLLIDHDVAVNYANWNYFAGIGNDPRNRAFKTVTQGERYDEEGALVATWLPALARLPPRRRHQPWLTGADGGGGDGSRQSALQPEGEAEKVDGVQGGAVSSGSGVDGYPSPIVEPVTQIGEGAAGKRKQ
jgi:deoxyribodipyrimidine photo-lyase